jgi:hypothetical protein
MGLFFLASISIAPNARRKPMLSSDGSIILGADGRVLTEFDTAGYLQSNWFGVTLYVMAGILFLLVTIRMVVILFNKLRVSQGGRA